MAITALEGTRPVRFHFVRTLKPSNVDEKDRSYLERSLPLLLLPTLMAELPAPPPPVLSPHVRPSFARDPLPLLRDDVTDPTLPPSVGCFRTLPPFPFALPPGWPLGMLMDLAVFLL